MSKARGPYRVDPLGYKKKSNEALDKKAENARELGLDYEPVWGGGPTNKDYEDAMRQRRLHQLTSPPAQRKPLTDEEWQSIADTLDCSITRGQKDAIEAALGIKENT